MAAGKRGAVQRRLLVVDDDTDSARMFAELLKVMGHDALAVTRPHEVAARVRTWKPHLVFLDLTMPGLDGWTLASQLRAEYPPEVLRLVAISGNNTDNARQKSRKAGFDAHLLKPASPDLIESSLAQFFSPPG